MNDPHYWEANYKSMSYEQLLTATVPMYFTKKEKTERMAFIAKELQLKAPKNDPA